MHVDAAAAGPLLPPRQLLDAASTRLVLVAPVVHQQAAV